METNDSIGLWLTRYTDSEIRFTFGKAYGAEKLHGFYGLVIVHCFRAGCSLRWHRRAPGDDVCRLCFSLTFHRSPPAGVPRAPRVKAMLDRPNPQDDELLSRTRLNAASALTLQAQLNAP